MFILSNSILSCSARSAILMPYLSTPFASAGSTKSTMPMLYLSALSTFVRFAGFASLMSDSFAPFASAPIISTPFLSAGSTVPVPNSFTPSTFTPYAFTPSAFSRSAVPMSSLSASAMSVFRLSAFFGLVVTPTVGR